jgi:SEC-C motif
MTTSPQKQRPIPANVLAPLREHVDFVVRAVDAHDVGFTSEITRVAVALRALFHSPTPYLSWLARAEGLHGGFLSTALPRDTAGVGRYGSLVITANFDGRAIYFCALDSAWFGRWVSFADWWNEPVFIDDMRKELSRRDVVLTVAAKDGGSNLDRNLTVAFARLSAFNKDDGSMDPSLALAYAHLAAIEAAGTTQNATSADESAERVTNQERAALRQIAHEALRTLIPTYRKFQKITNDERLNAALAKGIERPASLPFPPAIRRNDACPCGSGKKLKYCHGAI